MAQAPTAKKSGFFQKASKLKTKRDKARKLDEVEGVDDVSSPQSKFRRVDSKVINTAFIFIEHDLFFIFDFNHKFFYFDYRNLFTKCFTHTNYTNCSKS